MSEGGRSPVGPEASPQAPVSGAHGLECEERYLELTLEREEESDKEQSLEQCATLCCEEPDQERALDQSLESKAPVASTAESAAPAPSLVQEPSPVSAQGPSGVIVASGAAPAPVGASGSGASAAGATAVAAASTAAEGSSGVTVEVDVTAATSGAASATAVAPVTASGPGASAAGATFEAAASPGPVPGATLAAAEAEGGKDTGEEAHPKKAKQVSASVRVRVSALVSWKVDCGRGCCFIV